ncbi:MAG: O-antigen translocase [Burkholderiales bacterium]|nr:O-antigen translocase [Burkholderiales bacterium]
MSDNASYRQILRSSSIIGGASAFNIVISLLRTKVVAMLLGPAGIGLIGLLHNLMSAAATASALGFGNAGTRQIAEANGQDDLLAISVARRALFWGTLALAMAGSLVFWLLRGVIAQHVLGDRELASAVGWLALGVGLTVATGSQSALLTGMRRIGDVARLQIAASVPSTVVGLAAIWWLGTKGILLYVLIGPAVGFLFGYLYAARLPRIKTGPPSRTELIGQWKALLGLGSNFMVAGLTVTLGQLFVRTLVQRELGPTALGQFQAAWALSTAYIGFVLGAMGTDYYPRLTAVIEDKATANRLVNEQAEVALLLAGPVFLAIVALAPWAVRLFYTAEFQEAISILRWQVLGDILRTASVPVGYIMLAAGAGRTFMLSEAFAIGVFVVAVWVGLPLFGIQATGIGFALMYACYLPLVYWLARRRTGFSWIRRVAWQGVLLFVAAVFVCMLAGWREWAGALSGVLAALIFGASGLGRLAQMIGDEGRLGRLVVIGNQVIARLKVWR